MYAKRSRDMCNILLQSVQIRQTLIRFQESSPVLSTPDIILLTKAAAGKSGQERENESYLLLKTWIFLGGTVEYG